MWIVAVAEEQECHRLKILYNLILNLIVPGKNSPVPGFRNRTGPGPFCTGRSTMFFCFFFKNLFGVPYVISQKRCHYHRVITYRIQTRVQAMKRNVNRKVALL